MSRTAPVLLSLTCAVGLLAGVSAPATAEPGPGAIAPCQGRMPTIVSDRRVVTGTPGDDVIVVRGRRAEVVSGDGDDRICVRGPGGQTAVSPGNGDDRVRVEVRTLVVAELYSGTDTYRGGPGTDYVESGARGERNTDRISLGGGDDMLVLAHAVDHRGAVMRGGAGRDELGVDSRGGSLLVNAASERATLDGRAHARWRSFDAYTVSSAGRQTFVGSTGDDDVEFVGRGAVDARTSDGDDTVRLVVRPGPLTPGPRDPLDEDSPTSRTLRVDTGAGEDLLEVRTPAPLVHGDLATGRLRFSDEEGPLGSFGFVAVEGLSVAASDTSTARSRVELVGDDGDNVLQASACAVVLRGAAGDDRLRVGTEPPTEYSMTAGAPDLDCDPTSEVHGDAGDDELVSRVVVRGYDVVKGAVRIKTYEVPVADLLDGGEGFDTADAGAGQDTCVAETRVACEA